MRDYGDWCRRPEDYYEDDKVMVLAMVIAPVLLIMILVLSFICD